MRTPSIKLQQMRHLRWSMLASVCLAVLLVVLASPAQGHTDHEEEYDPEADMASSPATLEEDAQLYAAIEGLTPEEAHRRLTLSHEFAELLDEVHTESPDILAGSWFDLSSGGYVPNLRLVGEPSETVKRLIGDSAVADGGLVLHFDGTYSLAQRQEQMLSLHAALVDLLTLQDRTVSPTIVSYHDVESDRIVAEVETPVGELALPTADLRSRLGSDFPLDQVEFRFRVDIPVGDDHTYGGAKTTWGSGFCTTGFVVRSNTYPYYDGVLTAGHCNNNNRAYVEAEWPYGSYSMPYVTQHKGSYGDFQWHTTPHLEYDDFYYCCSSARRDVSGIWHPWQLSTNTWLTLYGRATGQYGSYVLSTGNTLTVSGITYGRLIYMQNYTASGGDSGGPWYSGNTAVGIHKGSVWVGGVKRSTLSSVSYVDEGLGVSIRS